MNNKKLIGTAAVAGGIWWIMQPPKVQNERFNGNALRFNIGSKTYQYEIGTGENLRIPKIKYIYSATVSRDGDYLYIRIYRFSKMVKQNQYLIEGDGNLRKMN